MPAATFILVMGVSGCGKTTIGKEPAAMLSRAPRAREAAPCAWTFLDADDFHPPANIAKMSAGIPLDDADRATWLAALRSAIRPSAVLRRNGLRPTPASAPALPRHHSRAVLTEAEQFVLVFLGDGTGGNDDVYKTAPALVFKSDSNSTGGSVGDGGGGGAASP